MTNHNWIFHSEFLSMFISLHFEPQFCLSAPPKWLQRLCVWLCVSLFNPLNNTWLHCPLPSQWSCLSKVWFSLLVDGYLWLNPHLCCSYMRDSNCLSRFGFVHSLLWIEHYNTIAHSLTTSQISSINIYNILEMRNFKQVSRNADRWMVGLQQFIIIQSNYHLRHFLKRQSD